MAEDILVSVDQFHCFPPLCQPSRIHGSLFQLPPSSLFPAHFSILEKHNCQLSYLETPSKWKQLPHPLEVHCFELSTSAGSKPLQSCTYSRVPVPLWFDVVLQLAFSSTFLHWSVLDREVHFTRISLHTVQIYKHSIRPCKS